MKTLIEIKYIKKKIIVRIVKMSLANRFRICYTVLTNSLLIFYKPIVINIPSKKKDRQDYHNKHKEE